MKIRSCMFAAGLALVAGALPATAGQINFDDISTGGSSASVPANYDGFTWSTWFYALDQGFYDQPYYGNTVTFPSSPNAGMNATGATEVDLFASTPTVFNDAAFSTFAFNNAVSSGAGSSTSVTVQGWNGSTLEWTASEDLTADFTYLPFGNAPVTEVKFFNDGSAAQWWLVDNINYNDPLSAVPEPITLSLFGAGVAGAVAMRRRKKTAAKA